MPQEPVQQMADQAPPSVAPDKDFEAAVSAIADAMKPAEQPSSAVPEKPAGSTDAPPALAAAPKVAAHLLERASEHGLSAEEAEEWGDKLERHLDAVDRQLAREYRQAQRQAPQQHRQERQPEPEPEDDSPLKGEWWKDGEEEMAPKVKAAFEGLQTHYGKTVKELQAKVDHLTGFLQQQAQSRDEQVVHDTCDKLQAAGYQELGKGRPRPGTAAFEARSKLAGIIAGQVRLLQQAGQTVGYEDLDWIGKLSAEALFRKQAQQQAPTAPQAAQEPPAAPKPAPAPRADGRVLMPGETDVPRDHRGRFAPTPSTRPTSRDQPPVQDGEGYDAAVEAVAELMRNGR